MNRNIRKLVAGLLAATALAGTACAAAPLSPPELKPAAIPARVSAIYKNAAQMCGPITGGAANPVIEQRIRDFNTIINKSATGRDLMQAAATYDSQPAWICFKSIKGLHAVYYTGNGVLSVGLNKSNDEIVADAAHELRHLFQDKAGIHKIKPREKNDHIHLEYAGEADAEATASLLMWELKEAGHAGPWNAHNNPLNYGPKSICYAHISTAFKDAMTRGESKTDATLSAFRAWYRDRDLLSFYKDSALEGIDVAKAPISTLHMHERTLQSSCYEERPANAARGYEIPSPYISEGISGVTGNLPSYNINYIQHGGGLRNILQGP